MNGSVVRDILQSLADAHDGRLTPDLVIEVAANPDSPLHPLIEWNDRVAAHAHRLNQARALIRSVRIEYRVTKFQTVFAPAYVRDPVATPLQGYIAVSSIKSETEVARDVMVSEFARASAALKRAREVALVLGLGSDIERLIGGLDLITDRIHAVAEGAAAN